MVGPSVVLLTAISQSKRVLLRYEADCRDFGRLATFSPLSPKSRHGRTDKPPGETPL